MSSPVATIGLAWHETVEAWLADPAGGYDLQRGDLDLLFAITEGIDTLPVVRGDDHIVPFRSGRRAAPRIADRRPVVVTGWLAGSGAAPEASYRAYVDELKGHLDPMGPEGVLVATLESGATRWIHAVPRNIMGGDGIGGEFRAMSIEWEALDPFWYATWGAWLLDTGLFLDDGLRLDEGSEVVFTPAGDPYIKSFTHPGTADVEKVRLEVDGPSAGLVGIFNVTNPATPPGFAFPALTAGQTLVVDSGLRVATLDGVQARADLALGQFNRHGEYFRLVKGSNTISIFGHPAEVRIIFDSAYL